VERSDSSRSARSSLRQRSGHFVDARSPERADLRRNRRCEDSLVEPSHSLVEPSHRLRSGMTSSGQEVTPSGHWSDSCTSSRDFVKGRLAVVLRFAVVRDNAVRDDNAPAQGVVRDPATLQLPETNGCGGGPPMLPVERPRAARSSRIGSQMPSSGWMGQTILGSFREAGDTPTSSKAGPSSGSRSGQTVWRTKPRPKWLGVIWQVILPGERHATLRATSACPPPFRKRSRR
jgi:hypothetical protein